MKTFDLRYLVSYFQLRLVIDKNLKVVSRWKCIERVYVCSKAEAYAYSRRLCNNSCEKVTIKKLLRREKAHV